MDNDFQFLSYTFSEETDFVKKKLWVKDYALYKSTFYWDPAEEGVEDSWKTGKIVFIQVALHSQWILWVSRESFALVLVCTENDLNQAT